MEDFLGKYPNFLVNLRTSVPLSLLFSKVIFTSGNRCPKIDISSIFIQIRLVMTSTRSGNPRKVHVKNPTKGTNITLHSFHISLLVTTILEKTER